MLARYAALAVFLAGALLPATGRPPVIAGRDKAPAIDHVFAPYFETYAGGNPFLVSAASGAKDISLAFLQAPAQQSCSVDWDGIVTTPVSYALYGHEILQIRSRGGNVVISFGGYAADVTGTDIAESCSSAGTIASVYEDVALTYGVTRIDLDVESSALDDFASIARRNHAVHLAEAWAARHHRLLQFTYTIPGFLNGPGADERRMLTNAVMQKAVITAVNFMTFDFPAQGRQDMAADSELAAQRLYAFLKGLYPKASPGQLWGRVGLVEMIGIDDSGKNQTFTLADGRAVEAWSTRAGIGELSFWALQRDNGGCPGRSRAMGDCSGLRQGQWQFSREMAPFG